MPKDFENSAPSPQEIKRLELERRTALADKDRQIHEEDGDELIALQADPDATQTATGRQIRRFATQHHKHIHHSFMEAIGLGSAIQIVQDLVTAWQKNLMAAPLLFDLASSAPKEEAQKALVNDYEDDGCVINMERVSQQTARILNQERAEIEEKVRELEGITDPEAHRLFAAKIVELAEQYEMLEHPQIRGHYIHNFERVQREEAMVRARGIIDCPEIISVYRIKAEIGGDAVKRQRAIGDVLNQDPGEVQLNVNERIAAEQSRPTPPTLDIH